VRRCLEKDREQRYQSARDLAFNLETVSAMSSSSTLAGTPRIVPTGASGASVAPTVRTSAAPPQARISGATAAPSRPPTVARPALKPKPRVSPVLLVLLYLVSIAGAAYGAWKWAQRTKETPPEAVFRRMTFRRGEVRTARFTPDGETIVYSAAWDGN